MQSGDCAESRIACPGLSGPYGVLVFCFCSAKQLVAILSARRAWVGCWLNWVNYSHLRGGLSRLSKRKSPAAAAAAAAH